MNIKEFLKPTKGRIILFLILMFGINYLWISGTIIFDAIILIGLPLPFYPIGTGPHIIEGSTSPTIPTFSYVNFTINIIFWYLLSCLIISTYNKFKAKKEVKERSS